MPGQLAAMIRSKYPGAYTDLDDATLEKQVLTKYPQYADLAQSETPTAAAPAKRPYTGGIEGSKWEDPNRPGQLSTTLTHENDPSFLSALAQSAASEVGGAVVGKGLKLVGWAMYRAGALPLVNMFGKYGDVIAKGIEEGVPVTQSGLQKASNLKIAAKATKDAAVSAADQTAGIRTQGVVDAALAKVQPEADALRRAGLGDPTQAFQARGGRILTENGVGLKPSELEGIKSTVDDTLGGAYKKLRMKESLSPAERMNMAIAHAAGDAQAQVVPGYKALNKEVMDAEGVRRMIARRLQGNQGLENALTMAIGPAALPARVAMLPGVASTAGIVTHRVGEHAAAPTAAAIRAALLAQMSSRQ